MCGTCHLFGIFLSNEPMMEETPKMAGICLKVFIRNKAAASFPPFFHLFIGTHDLSFESEPVNLENNDFLYFSKFRVGIKRVYVRSVRLHL